MATNEDHLKDDLEKKIDEAEMEAQMEESKAASGSSVEGEVKESSEDTPVIKEKPSRARLIFRKILVWLVIITIAFAAGFFVDAILRYQPALAEIELLNSELEIAGEDISDLELEVNRLGNFEEKNVTLEEEIAQVTIHLTLLSARAAVADATLALEQDRPADAKVALEKVGSTLENLKSLLSADQADVVEKMIQRYDLIMNEFDDEGFSAQSDLELLTGRLNSLENTLFLAP